MPYNPFAGWPITGTWADHMSYSLGGTDYPLPYGTVLHAPAAGTLRTSGGWGEFAAGWIGSAGRRSVFTLDAPIRDVVAVVFQHQSAFGMSRHFVEGEAGAGFSGASANNKDWGGDVHLHIHCLTASGARRRFEDYFTSGSTAGDTASPIDNQSEEDDMTPEQSRKFDEQSRKIDAIFEVLFHGASWTDKDKANHKTNYGLVQIDVHTQSLVAKQSARLAAIEKKLTD